MIDLSWTEGRVAIGKLKVQIILVIIQEKSMTNVPTIFCNF